jgi:N-formylglutamate amidohydrolase
MILHIPHSSRTIPADVRRKMRLSDEELELELNCMTDRWTDDLFSGAARDLDAVIVYPASRLVVDPERFVEDASEPMAAHGMGAIYLRTSHGMLLREAPAPEEREDLLARYYHSHHHLLDKAVERELRTSGNALIIDCHSYPLKPLPYEQDPSRQRPEICIGTDDFHTPPDLGASAARLFGDRGYGVALNTPFAGSIVPSRWFRRDPTVRSIMIEVRRDLYMDERTGERLPGFDALRADVQEVIRDLASSPGAA